MCEHSYFIMYIAMNRFKIIKVPHYANYTNKEKYREQIKTIFKF